MERANEEERQRGRKQGARGVGGKREEINVGSKPGSCRTVAGGQGARVKYEL